MYDIVYVGKSRTDSGYLQLKKRFPTVKFVTDLENAAKVSFTKFYYIVWEDLIVNEDFHFDYVPDIGSQDYVHLFLNNGSYDGICLIPKKYKISKREFEHRFFVHRKELKIEASKPNHVDTEFDIIFISYNETNAEKNFLRLLEKAPNAKHVKNIRGIHNAHKAAALTADSSMFYVVDGDAYIVEDFDFNKEIHKYQRDTVYVWRSINPINDLEYGYGGIKLLPKQKTLNMDVNSADMTTSISPKFQVINEVSNITMFNTDPFNTWKSAFRECAKLSSKIIDRQDTGETNERLKVWTTVGKDKAFGEYALAGARTGMEFGSSNNNDIKLINNFDWLYEQFSKNTLG